MVKSIKGAERRTIVVKTSDSGIFETAFFVMKCGIEEKYTQGDMVAEALRIINGVTNQTDRHKSNRRTRLKRFVWFAASAALGAGIASIIFLLAR